MKQQQQHSHDIWQRRLEEPIRRQGELVVRDCGQRENSVVSQFRTNRNRSAALMV